MFGAGQVSKPPSPARCINCSKQIQPVLKYLKIDQVTLISVPSAINYIFNLSPSQELVNKDQEPFGSCSLCAALICKLYELHKQLEKLTQLDSVIGKLLSTSAQHRRSGRLFPFPIPPPSVPLVRPSLPRPIHHTGVPIITKVVSVPVSSAGAVQDSQLPVHPHHSPKIPGFSCSPDPESQPNTPKIEAVPGLLPKNAFDSDSEDDNDPYLEEPLVQPPDEPMGTDSEDTSQSPDPPLQAESVDPEKKKPKRRRTKVTDPVKLAAIRLKKRERVRKRGPVRKPGTIEHPPCPICGKVLVHKRADWLEVHMMRKHNDVDPRFICTICGKPNKNRVFMEIHERTHLNSAERVQVEAELGIQRGFLCPECGKVLSLESSLKNHLRIVHGDASTRLRRCEEPGCDYSCVSEKTLKRHHSQVHDPRFTPFRCQQCDKCFGVYTQLKDHEMLECDAANRPFVCQECPRRFKKKQALMVHLHDVHKFSPAEAREKVYPGLACPNWVGRERKDKHKTRSRKRRRSNF